MALNKIVRSFNRFVSFRSLDIIKFSLSYELLHMNNSNKFCHIKKLTTSALPSSVNLTCSKKQKLNIQLNEEKDNYDILSEDGVKLGALPAIWLRDNCLCKSCYHPSSKHRLLLMKNLDINVEIISSKICDDKLLISWSDGHKSEFPVEWLLTNTFAYNPGNTKNDLKPIKSSYWNANDFQDKIPSATFSELVNDDRSLFEWICNLEKYGVFLIKEAPKVANALQFLSTRCSYSRKTSYGEYFTVKAKVDATNAAYTSADLGFHTDLAYYDYCPGMQMLHCIAQVPTQGGENMLSDGFYCADILRNDYPEHFKTLSEIPLEHVDEGIDYTEYYNYFCTPMIKCSHDGSFYRITYSNHSRTSKWNIPPELVKPYYTALKTYNGLFYKKENHIRHKMSPGDVLCFHNYRVLHARTAFEVLGSGMRHLEGAYIDWDELHSKRRILQRANDFQSWI